MKTDNTYHITVKLNLKLTADDFDKLRRFAGQKNYAETMFKIIKSKTKGIIENPIVTNTWKEPTGVYNTGVIEPTNSWLEFNIEED